MPVLPLIDALILLGWSSLLGGFLLKAIYVTTAYRPTVFTLTPIDFLVIAVVCLLFALTLAARTWVRLNEPVLAARRRKRGMARYQADPGEGELLMREEERLRAEDAEALEPSERRAAQL